MSKSAFIQWFVNWAASYLANRKELKDWYKMEDFLRQKWEEKELF